MSTSELELQKSLIDSIKILISHELRNFKTDITKRGRVHSVNLYTCVVEMDGEYHTCKLSDGISVNIGDVVLVSIPSGNFTDKYVTAKMWGTDSTTRMRRMIGATLPAASEAYRGEIFTLVADGQADKTYVCVKTGTTDYVFLNSTFNIEIHQYAWKEVTFV